MSAIVEKRKTSMPEKHTSDSDEEDSEEDSDEDSDEDSEEDSWFRDDLKYIGRTRLEKLEVLQLRKECLYRDIDIKERAHKETCIQKLLDWKRAQNTINKEEEEEEND